MERRVNKRINEYVSGFKQNVKTEIIKIIEKNKESQANGSAEATERDKALRSLLQYVCDYEKCELTSADFEKRKRSKNNVPIHEQCIAKKADNTRCTRRKRDGSHFCGTHIKGTPHGFIEENTDTDDVVGSASIKINNMVSPSNFTSVNNTKKVEIWLEDINGIMHYIDNNFNVYDNEDIKKGINNPKVIYKYEKDYVNGEEIYTINSSNQLAS